MTVDQSWVKSALMDKVTAIDWNEATADVTRFLSMAEQQSLKLWGERFFLNKVEKI